MSGIAALVPLKLLIIPLPNISLSTAYIVGGPHSLNLQARCLLRFILNVFTGPNMAQSLAGPTLPLPVTLTSFKFFVRFQELPLLLSL